MTAGVGEAEAYAYHWQAIGDSCRMEVAPIIEGVVADLADGLPGPQISRRFHATLTALFSALCREIRQASGLDRVVMSGGVFQNVLLATALSRELEHQGFKVFTQRLVPPNDGGISLGQAVAAAAMWARAA